jgi:hypothetical protein
MPHSRESKGDGCGPGLSGYTESLVGRAHLLLREVDVGSLTTSPTAGPHNAFAAAYESKRLLIRGSSFQQGLQPGHDAQSLQQL